MSDLFWQMNKTVAGEKETGEKHTPVIKVEGHVAPKEVVTITIDVGENKHPNTNGHHIQWVELRGNGLYLARAEFSPEVSMPVARFNVVVPDKTIKLTAVSRCNLHGLWESEPFELKVN